MEKKNVRKKSLGQIITKMKQHLKLREIVHKGKRVKERVTQFEK